MTSDTGDTESADKKTPEGKAEVLSIPGYLKKWLREEKFWQDVTTRTLAGGIVVILGFLLANATGLFGDDRTRTDIYQGIVRILIDIVVVIVGGLVLVVLSARLSKNLSRGQSESVALLIRIAVRVVAGFIFLLLVISCDIVGAIFWQGLDGNLPGSPY